MAKKNEAASGEEKVYTVLQNLRHDGKHYNPKSELTLADDEAKVLVDAGVVEPKK